jgi:hypothetical protein
MNADRVIVGEVLGDEESRRKPSRR